MFGCVWYVSKFLFSDSRVALTDCSLNSAKHVSPGGAPGKPAQVSQLSLVTSFYPFMQLPWIQQNPSLAWAVASEVVLYGNERAMSALHGLLLVDSQQKESMQVYLKFKVT